MTSISVNVSLFLAQWARVHAGGDRYYQMVLWSNSRLPKAPTSLGSYVRFLHLQHRQWRYHRADRVFLSSLHLFPDLRAVSVEEISLQNLGALFSSCPNLKGLIASFRSPEPYRCHHCDRSEGDIVPNDLLWAETTCSDHQMHLKAGLSRLYAIQISSPSATATDIIVSYLSPTLCHLDISGDFPLGSLQPCND